ncbi:PREDICTED: uncharacterized protein LOC109174031 [Ipomoea nil]|uniref:uncharacterized protein LOC109174031 n=1 Tax=Ipomoea nil TaxID=35883 RepID=UPI0009017C78|nr:PREDICTED: uncharacterized protein LOC109174031 [Ipomoea nil]
MVDETAGADLMSCMDAFKGYHQVMMAREDESKTAFVTPDSLYCYKVMPFGLWNAGATYQRMVNLLFEKLLGHTMEAYIDDILVKSHDRGRVIRVLTDQPIGAVLRTAAYSGRLVKWALMLTQFAIEYKPRPAIKGQALADFVVECIAREMQPQASEDPDAAWWAIATYGSSIRELGADYVRAQTDSSLVMGQVLGDYEVNGDRLLSYRDLALEKLNNFKAYAVRHVSRLDNVDADVLSKLAQDAPEHISKIAQIVVVPAPSINRLPIAPIQDDEETWITDIMGCLQDERAE